MNIIGIGTQVVECARVRRLLERHGETFLSQVYTLREQQFCGNRVASVEHYAALWAAKEAVYRSMGTTWRRGMAWTEVEILMENPVEPTVVLIGAARSIRDARGAGTLLLTTARCRHFATATAIALRG